jgi:hypothetical protein
MKKDKKNKPLQSSRTFLVVLCIGFFSIFFTEYVKAEIIVNEHAGTCEEVCAVAGGTCISIGNNPTGGNNNQYCGAIYPNDCREAVGSCSTNIVSDGGGNVCTYGDANCTAQPLIESWWTYCDCYIEESTATATTTKEDIGIIYYSATSTTNGVTTTYTAEYYSPAILYFYSFGIVFISLFLSLIFFL